MRKTMFLGTVMNASTFAAAQALGFTFTRERGPLAYANSYERDRARGPIEQEAILPEGWNVTPQPDTSSWHDVRDEYGRIRGHHYRKLSVGDPDAFFALYGRYMINSPRQVDGHPPYVYDVVDRLAPQTPLFTSERFVNEYDPSRDAPLKACNDWLEAHFPGWSEATRYWDPPNETDQSAKTQGEPS